MNKDDIGKRLTERMTKSERDQSFPDSVPRDAATLILIDRSGPDAESAARPPPRQPQIHAGQIRVSRRPHRSRPTRRWRRRASSMPRGDGQDRHARRATTRCRAARLPARRDPRDLRGDRPDARRQSATAAASRRTEWEAFAKAGVLPDLANIHFIARAITPPRRPRRFDTRFFTADASRRAQVEGVVGPDSELVELVWMPIKEARRSTCRPSPATCWRNSKRASRRHGPRPAGAVLPHGAPAVLPRTAV